MNDKDRILPLGVAGGAALLVALAAIDGLSGSPTPAVEAVPAVVAEAADTAVTTVTETAGEVADAAADAAGAAVEAATDAASATVEAVADTAQAATETVTEASETVADGADAAATAAETATEEATEAVAETGAATADAVADTAQAATETVTEAAETVADGADAAADAAATATEEVAEQAQNATATTAAAATVAGAAAAASGAFDPATMTDAQREAFRAEVRSYLMDNPEVIIEAVNSLEQRQAQAQGAADMAMVEANMDALVNDPYSWVGGNPDGDVTIVEFMDYRCGYCRRAAPEVEELVSSDGNIRIIIKEFPILGEASMISSRFAIASHIVGGDDGYKAVHDALMALTTDPTDDVLRDIATAAGLDADAVFEQLANPRVEAQIRETRALAQALQINGTPTFVFGTQMLRGYVPLDGMRQVVADLRESQGQ